MSNNVFGNPVTDATVRQVFIGITNITQRHRAQVALMYMNADEKAQQARKFVLDLSLNYQLIPVMTLCAIYNATGSNLLLAGNHSWEGNVWRSPYPNVILNGQWAAFLHIAGSNSFLGRSKEAVVYRGVNGDGQTCNWILAWNTNFPLNTIINQNNQNRVLADPYGDFSTINWNNINSFLERNRGNDVGYNLGCFSSAAIGGHTGVTHFTGIMGLADLRTLLPLSLDKGMNAVDEPQDEATPASAAATPLANAE